MHICHKSDIYKNKKTVKNCHNSFILTFYFNIFIKMYTRLNSNRFFLAFEGKQIKCIYLFISHTN